MFRKLKERIRSLKQAIVPVYYALFDNRTPFLARILASLTVFYVLSPIDLIPDIIPVLGLLDDLLIVPLLLKVTLKLIPKAVIEDIRSKIDSTKRLKQKWYYAIPIVGLYVYIIFILARQILR